MTGERILVVEDERAIANVLRRGLALEGYIVEVADGGRAALDAVRDRPPELVILDLMLPDIDGLEVARRLREAGERAPVLMLTARDGVADRVRGLDAGADDYLVKPFAFEELLARVRALLRRAASQTEGTNHTESLKFADLVVDLGTRDVRRGGHSIELTAREFDLLILFLRNPRQVLPRDLIMDRVWGDDFYGESNVLEVYVRALRTKLEEHGETRLIHTVRGVGYTLREREIA
ncbi:MAG: response regulator transcription factor [Chloroflexota bacterium]|nr:response regulator transcription factor [Chloroflexota bacterium]